MTALVVLNAPTPRHVELHPDLFEAALKTFQIEAGAVLEGSVGFVADGVCLGISHTADLEQSEILILHVDEKLIDSLFGPTFAEEHGGWFEMKPCTVNDMIAHFIQVSLSLRETLQRPVKIRVIRIT